MDNITCTDFDGWCPISSAKIHICTSFDSAYVCTFIKYSSELVKFLVGIVTAAYFGLDTHISNVWANFCFHIIDRCSSHRLVWSDRISIYSIYIKHGFPLPDSDPNTDLDVTTLQLEQQFSLFKTQKPMVKTDLEKSWSILVVYDLEWLYWTTLRRVSCFLCYFLDPDVWLETKTCIYPNWTILFSPSNIHLYHNIGIANHSSCALHHKDSLVKSTSWPWWSNDCRGNWVLIWNNKNWQNKELSLFWEQPWSFYEEVRHFDRRYLNDSTGKSTNYFYWFPLNCKIDYTFNWHSLFQRIAIILDLSFQYNILYFCYD